ncbi:MAG: hypothetical protein QOF09_3067, partial [Alphaproteobacteria bacterium]|nr:hypothetical protein [Alphaproteobacteria bacterium]
MHVDSEISIGAKVRGHFQSWWGAAANPVATLGMMHIKIPRKLASYVVTKRVFARNERTLVSFTFDDVPESTFIHGAPVLEHHAVRGTFYVSGGLCDKFDDDRHIIGASECVALHRRGHEI